MNFAIKLPFNLKDSIILVCLTDIEKPIGQFMNLVMTNEHR